MNAVLSMLHRTAKLFAPISRLEVQVLLAARYLWGRKLRTFLTTLAILFGTLVIFSTNLLMPTMVKAFQSNLMAASGQVDVTVTLTTGEAFSRNVLNRLKSVEGISAIAGSLSRTVNIPDQYYRHARIAALTLTGIDPRAAQNLRSYLIKEGRFLRPSDDEVAVITQSLADELGLTLGDNLSLPTTGGNVKLRVVGLMPARALPGNEEVLVTLVEAQKLLDLPNRMNTIEINLATTQEAEREAIQNNIKAALGDDYTLGGLSSGSEILASMRLGQAMFNLFGFLALFMGAFIIFNTFRTIVAERRRDIGMLRAVGAGRGTIIGLILMEGLLQGVVGSVGGIFVGYFLGAGTLKLMSSALTWFMHLEIGNPVIQPGLIAMTIGFGVCTTLLAGLLPAFSASRIAPLEALRPSMTDMVQRSAKAGGVIGWIMIGLALAGLFAGGIEGAALGAMLFLTGLVLVAPMLVKPVSSVFARLVAAVFARDGTGMLAQSNLTRQPARAAVTASATMIGLAIIVAMGGMIWSLTGGFMEILERSLGSDYLIIPPSVGVWKSNVGAGSELADDLRAVSGVAEVSTMRFASATVDGTAVSMLGIDPVIYPRVANLTFQQGNTDDAYAVLGRERAIIANGILAAQLGLKPGSTVRLSTPTGQKEYLVVAVAGDYLNAKITTAYISQDNLEADFRKTEDVLFQISLLPGADPSQVEPRLKKDLEEYPQFKLISGQSYFEENKQLFNAAFAFYFVFLGILAFPSLIALLNTLAIGVIERTREIGMLRAIGAAQKQVRRMVIVESLLLAAIGTAFGLLAGLYLGYVMVLGLDVGGFPIPYEFPYVGLLAAIATGLLFGVVAALVPARQAAEMDIVRALRYE